MSQSVKCVNLNAIEYWITSVWTVFVLGSVYTYHVPHRLCIRVYHHLCQIYIVYTLMVRSAVRMGSEPILFIKQSVSIDTMLNFDGDSDGDGYGDGTCKQALSI